MNDLPITIPSLDNIPEDSRKLYKESKGENGTQYTLDPAELVMGGMIGSMLGGFFADGGSVKGNVPIIVGERGPELFVPPTNGEIISNEALRNLPTNDNIRGIPDDIARGTMQAHLAGNFAGFFAGGGKVAAGSTIVGGERGRELAGEKRSWRIMTALATP